MSDTWKGQALDTLLAGKSQVLLVYSRNTRSRLALIIRFAYGRLKISLLLSILVLVSCYTLRRATLLLLNTGESTASIQCLVFPPGQCKRNSWVILQVCKGWAEVNADDVNYSSIPNMSLLNYQSLNASKVKMYFWRERRMVRRKRSLYGIRVHSDTSSNGPYSACKELSIECCFS